MNPNFFLKNFIKQGQTKFVIEILNSRFSDLENAKLLKDELIIVSSRMNKLERQTITNSITQVDKELEFNKITLATLSLIEQFSPILKEKYRVEKKENIFENNLKNLLDRISSFCQKNDIYPYTPVTLFILLEEQGGIAHYYFNLYKPGLSNLLRISLKQFIKIRLIAERKGQNYSKIEWQNRPEIKTALGFAWLESEKVIFEKHFLLGLVNSPSKTILSLKEKHNFDPFEFSKIILTDQSNMTPDF